MTSHHRIMLLVVLAALLSGCSTQMKWFGAGGVCTEWDSVDYKAYSDQQKMEARRQQGGSFRGEVQTLMDEAEEEQRRLDFGACSDNDLANHTCH